MQKVGAKPSGALAGYIGKDSESGDRFLFKFVDTPEHAANDVLAAHLYRSAGVCVPDIRRGRVRKSGGKTGPMGDAILSPWPWIYTLEQQVVTRASTATLSEAEKRSLATSFLVDAWHGAWDAVGLKGDNLLRNTAVDARATCAASCASTSAAAHCFTAPARDSPCPPWREEICRSVIKSKYPGRREEK